MKLKKGRTYRFTGKSGRLWTNGEVYLCKEDGYLETDRGQSASPYLFAECFEEVHIGFVETVSRDTPKKHKNTYEFKVSSEDAISHSEIMGALTREHPVAIVKRSDGMHTVLIHESLNDKCYYVEESLRDEYFAALELYWDGYQPYSSGALKKLMKVLKKLKVAPYKNKGELTCQVEILSI